MTEYTRGRGLWDTRTVFLLDQVCHVFNNAEEAKNATQVEQMVGELAWLREASTEACHRWIVAAVEKQKQRIAAAVAHRMAAEDQRKRRADTENISTKAPKKLKDEAETKQKKTDEAAQKRKDALTKQAAVEYLRRAFGDKQVAINRTLQDKLNKACKFSQTVAPGHHTILCNFNPKWLEEMLQRSEKDRATMHKQFIKTTTSPKQVEAALNHIYDPLTHRPHTPAQTHTPLTHAHTRPHPACRPHSPAHTPHTAHTPPGQVLVVPSNASASGSASSGAAVAKAPATKPSSIKSSGASIANGLAGSSASSKLLGSAKVPAKPRLLKTGRRPDNSRFLLLCKKTPVRAL